MRTLLCTAFLLVMAACGKGGGGGNSDDPPPAVPPDPPQRNMTLHSIGPCTEELSAEAAAGRLTWAWQCGYLSERTREHFRLDDDGLARLPVWYPSFMQEEDKAVWWQAPVSGVETHCFTKEVQQFDYVVGCDHSRLPEPDPGL